MSKPGLDYGWPIPRGQDQMSNPKTVRVRIAVLVRGDGSWNADGFACKDGTTQAKYDEEVRSELVCGMEPSWPYVVRFIEADVPIPVAETLQGELST